MLQLRLVTDAIVNEPQDGDGPLVVVGEVVRTGNTDEPVTVLIGLFDGGATRGEDYRFAAVHSASIDHTIEITLEAGQASRPFSVDVLPDAVPEIEEDFMISLMHIVTPTQHPHKVDEVLFWDRVTVTENDDARGIVGIVGGPVHLALTEPATGTSATVEIVLGREAGLFGEVEVTWEVTGDVTGEDFDQLRGTVVFGDQESTTSITLRLRDDDVPELDESLQLTLTDIDGGAKLADTASRSITATIQANDAPHGIVSLVHGDRSVQIIDGYRIVMLHVERSWGTIGGLTVPFSVRYKRPGSSSCFAQTFLPAEASFRLNNPSQHDYELPLAIPETAQLEQGGEFCIELLSVALDGSSGTPTSTGLSPELGANSDAQVRIAADTANGIISAVSRTNRDGAEPADATTPTRTLNVLVARIGGYYGDVDVSWEVTPTSPGAVVPGDIGPATGSSRFASGDPATIMLIPLSIMNDAEPELEETFRFSLLDLPNGYAIFDDDRTTTDIVIPENDFPYGILEFSAAAYDTLESVPSGTVNLEVVRRGGTHGRLAVNYATSQGTAAAVTNFVSQSGTLIFEQGLASQTVTIEIVDSQARNPQLSFGITLDGLVGPQNVDQPAQLGTIASAVINIQSCVHCVVGLSEDSLLQVAANAGEVRVQIERNPHAYGELEVAWQLSGTTFGADPSADFGHASGIAQFAHGSATTEVVINLVADTDPELDERFELQLSSTSGEGTIAIPASRGVMILASDYPYGRFTVGASSRDVAVAETDRDTMVAIELVREGGAFGNVLLNFATVQLTGSQITNLGAPPRAIATAGSDFVPAQGAVLFRQGQRTAFVGIQTTGDSIPELNETFMVQLNAATVQPWEIESQPFSQGTCCQPTGCSARPEPDWLPLTGSSADANLALCSALVHSFSIQFCNGGAPEARSTSTAVYDCPGTGFDSSLATSFSCASFAQDACLAASTWNYSLAGALPLPMMNIDQSLATLEDPFAVVTILASDFPRGVFGFATTAVRVDESESSVELTIERSAGAIGVVTVEVQQRSAEPGGGQDAEEGTDFLFQATSVIFAEDERSKTIIIDISNDALPEEEESIVLALHVSAAQAPEAHVSEISGVCIVVISANDAAFGVFRLSDATLLPQTVPEHEVAAAQATFVVTREGGGFGTVEVSWVIEAESEEEIEGDVSPATGTVVFAPDVYEAMVSVSVLPDSIPEIDEIHLFRLTAASNGGQIDDARSSANLHIPANDHPHGVLHFDDCAGCFEASEELGGINITVIRTAGTFGDISVDYRTVDGIASQFQYRSMPTARTLRFAPGETIKTVFIEIYNDDSPELAMDFQFVLETPQGGALLPSPTVQTIVIGPSDDAFGRVEFGVTVESLVVAEPVAGILTIPFELIRAGGLFNTVVVEWRIQLASSAVDSSVYCNSQRDPDACDPLLSACNNQQSLDCPVACGACHDAADFAAATGQVTFAFGASSPSEIMAIAVQADAIPELDETFAIELRAFSGGVAIGARDTTLVTVLANGHPHGLFSIDGPASITVQEGGVAHVPVLRAGGSFGDIELFWIITSTSGDFTETDINVTHGSIRFPEGALRGSVDLLVEDDLLPELFESLEITLTSASGDGISGALSAPLSTHQIRIIVPPNDDPYGTFDVANGGATVAESAEYRSLNFDIVRSGGTTDAVRVYYSILMANSADGACAAQTVLQMQTFSINSSTEYTRSLTYSADVGYTLVPRGSVLLADGDSSYHVHIQIPNDKLLSLGSQFCVELTQVSRASLISGNAGNISPPRLDGQILVHINVGPTVANGIIEFASGTQGAQEGSEFSAPVFRRNGVYGRVAVQWNFPVSDMSAANLDPLSGIVEIQHGASSGLLVATATQDDIPELVQRYFVYLTRVVEGNAAINLAASACEVTLDENDHPYGLVSFNMSRNDFLRSEIEDNQVSVRLERAHGTFGTVTVLVYAPALTGSYTEHLVFHEGQDGADLIIHLPEALAANSDPEVIFQLALMQPVGGLELGSPSSATINFLICQDCTCGFPVSERSQTVAEFDDEDEGSGSVVVNEQIEFTVTRSPHAFGQSSVAWSVHSADDSTSDLSAYEGVAVFENRESTAVIRLYVLPDNEPELDELFVLRLDRSSGETLLGSGTQAVLTIRANDYPYGLFELAPAGQTAVEPALGQSSYPITVLRQGGAVGPVRVALVLAFGENSDPTSADGTDLALDAAYVDFADGQISGIVNVLIAADTTPELRETATVLISGVTMLDSAHDLTADDQLGISPSHGRSHVNIEENDDARGLLSFVGAEHSVSENDASAILRVDRHQGSFGWIELAWELRRVGTAGSAADDFAQTAGILTFAEGQTQAELLIPLINDAEPEDVEVFEVELSTDDSRIHFGQQHIVELTVEANDDAFGVVGFAETSRVAVASEGTNHSTVTLNLTRTAGLFGVVTAEYNVGPYASSSNDSLDVTPLTGSVQFAPGVDRAAVLLTILADDIPEARETFVVSIIAVYGGARIEPEGNSAILEIPGNDYLHGVLEFPTGRLVYSVNEADTYFEASVVRRGGDVGDVSVAFRTADASAKSGSDYIAISGTLHFLEGEREKVIRVQILDDDLPEADEELAIVLFNATGGAVLGLSSQLVVEQQSADAATLQAAHDEATATDAALAAVESAAASDAAAATLAESTAELAQAAVELGEMTIVHRNNTDSLDEAIANRVSTTSAAEAASERMEASTASLSAAHAEQVAADTAVTRASDVLGTTVTRSVDFKQEPGSISLANSLPASESTQTYHDGLTITGRYDVSQGFNHSRLLSVWALRGFGVVGSACDGTCISGSHYARFAFNTSVSSLLLQNVYTEDGYPDGDLTIEAFDAEDASLGRELLTRNGDGWYDVSAAFGSQRIKTFLLYPEPSILRVSALDFVAVTGTTYELARAAYDAALAQKSLVDAHVDALAADDATIATDLAAAQFALQSAVAWHSDQVILTDTSSTELLAAASNQFTANGRVTSDASVAASALRAAEDAAALAAETALLAELSHNVAAVLAQRVLLAARNAVCETVCESGVTLVINPNDDAFGVFSIGSYDNLVAEGQALSVQIQRGQGLFGSTSVSWELSTGGAAGEASADDVGSTSGMASFPPGVNSVVVNIIIMDDVLPEESEIMSFSLVAADGGARVASENTSSVSITIDGSDFTGLCGTQCLNGATCFPGLFQHTCVCAPGYAGVSCEVDIDDCIDVQCRNGGTCTDLVDDYICACVNDFGGKLCQDRPKCPAGRAWSLKARSCILQAVPIESCRATCSSGTVWSFQSKACAPPAAFSRPCPIDGPAPVFIDEQFERNLSEWSPVAEPLFIVEASPVHVWGQDLTYTIVGGNVNDAFHISSETGEVSLLHELDYESLATYNLSIQVQDAAPTPQSDATYVVVGVQDANDNQPSFDALEYSFAVHENTPLLQSFATLSATDQDDGANAQLSFSITSGNTENAFHIEADTGALSVAAQLNATLLGTYSLTVTVADRGLRVLSNTAEVSLVIEQFPPPVFDTSGYHFDVTESAPPGTSTLVVTARPHADIPNRGMRYQLLQDAIQYSSLPFIISNSGEISVSGALDREIVSEYTLVIAATDFNLLPHTSFANLTIVILDENDTPPTFTASAPTVNIREERGLGPIGLTLYADDGDAGLNGTVEYSVQPADPYFAVNLGTGEMTLVQSLVDVGQVEHRITIVAADRGESSLSSSVEVMIHVTIFEPPEFTTGSYSFDLPENSPLTNAVGRVTAAAQHDGTDLSIAYSIAESDYHGEPRISINQGTGLLIVERDIDREDVATINLIIAAQDAGPLSKVTLVPVTVTVQDLNDNNPTVSNLPHELVVRESVAVHTTLFTVEAFDADFEQSVVFELVSGDASLFAVSSTGELQLLAPLYEQGPTAFALVINATDNGSPPRTTQSDLAVSVIRFPPPQFTDTEYNTEIPEDLPAGSFVNVNIHAAPQHDRADQGMGYAIERIQASGPSLDVAQDVNLTDFAIVEATGIMYTGIALDRERFDRYTISVSATDRSELAKTSTVSVVVSIADLNDNPPRLSSDRYVVSVNEEAEVGRIILTVLAFDWDSDANSLFRYEVVGLPSDEFSMDVDTGELSITRSLNGAMQDFFQGYVIVHDPQSAAMQAQAPISISVVHFGPPVFDEIAYEATVTEGCELATAVITLHAAPQHDGVDPVVRYTLEDYVQVYKWVNGEHTAVDLGASTPFMIDARTGRVFTDQSIDREEAATYVIRIRATDNGPLAKSSDVTLTVSIADLNDNAPAFDWHEPSSYSIRESVEVGFTIGAQVAYDQDAGGNGTVRYEIATGNGEGRFAIDAVEGTLTVATALDGEWTSQYLLTVVAADQADSGVPQSSIRQINIEVTFFLGPILDFGDSNQLEVPENAEGSYALVALDAQVLHDADDTSATFRIVSQIGHRPELKCMIGTVLHSFDDDNSSACSTAPSVQEYVSVTFQPGSYVIVVDGYASAGGAYQLSVLDTGCDPASFIPVSSSEDASAFAQGSIATCQTIAGDTSTAPNTAPSNGNDHGYTIDVSIETTLTISTCGSTIDTTLFVYRTVNAEESVNLFTLDASSGVLQVRDELDREAFERVTVAIEVTDHALRPKTTNVIFEISVTDVNDNSPRFDQDGYAIDVLEWASGTIGHITACDRDADENGALHYELVSGGEGIFTLNSVTGAIDIVSPLDASVAMQYTLEVRAEDSGAPDAQDSTEYVQVTVVHFGPPVFDSDVSTVTVTENVASGHGVASASASPQHNESNQGIEYTIIDGDSSGAFTISSSGLITTVQDIDRETTASYTLTIRARDFSTLRKAAVTVIAVTIIDLNDNPPLLADDGIFNLDVLESSRRDHVVTTIQPVDVDESPEITFRLQDANEDFRVDSSTGVVSVSGGLNSTRQSSYTLFVIVSDGGETFRSSAFTVATLNIAVVHYGPPQFSLPEYDLRVSEATCTGGCSTASLVGTVIASPVHPESDRTISYQIIQTVAIDTSKKYSDWAVCAEEGAECTCPNGVVRFGSMDDSFENWFETSIVGSIGGTSVDCTTATFGDPAPLMPSPGSFTRWIGPKTCSCKTLLAPARANVTGAVAPFEINADGTIVASVPLNREDIGAYDLVVSAQDQSTLQKISHVTVHVTVEDINDETPVFFSAALLAVIREDMAVGSTVFSVVALDADLEDSGRTSYELDTAASADFNIDVTTGKVTVRRSLDALSQPVHIVTVTATDNEAPETSATLTCTVSVTPLPTLTATDIKLGSYHQPDLTAGAEGGLQGASRDVAARWLVSASDRTNGRWFYTIGESSAQTALPIFDGSNAMLLPATARIGFVASSERFVGVGQMTFNAYNGAYGDVNVPVVIDSVADTVDEGDVSPTAGTASAFALPFVPTPSVVHSNTAITIDSIEQDTSKLTNFGVDLPELFEANFMFSEIDGGAPPGTVDGCTARFGCDANTLAHAFVDDVHGLQPALDRAVFVEGMASTIGVWQYALSLADQWVNVSTNGVYRLTEQHSWDASVVEWLAGPVGHLRFVPHAGMSGVAQITVRAWQGKHTDASAPYAVSDVAHVSIAVIAIARSPQLIDTTPVSVLISGRFNYQTLAGTSVSSIVDAKAILAGSSEPVTGLAVVNTLVDTNSHCTSVSDAGNCGGMWQYRSGTSTAWLAFPAGVAPHAAVLLSGTDEVRFYPHPNYFWQDASAVHLEFKAWNVNADESGQSGYGAIDTTAPGTGFSTGTAFVQVSRDYAPISADSNLGCDFVPHSRTTTDTCGICGGNDRSQDCNGECFGTASVDECNNECTGGTTGRPANAAKDCAGVCNGHAAIDSCGNCAGGQTGREANYEMDCGGVCGGAAVFNSSWCPDQTICADPSVAIPKDCDGICLGSAVLDGCGDCTGGLTAKIFNPMACVSTTSVDPLHSTMAGGQMILVTGEGFVENRFLHDVQHKCRFSSRVSGAQYFSRFTVLSPSQLLCASPRVITAGRHDMAVTFDGVNYNTITFDFAFYNDPSILSRADASPAWNPQRAPDYGLEFASLVVTDGMPASFNFNGANGAVVVGNGFLQSQPAPHCIGVKSSPNGYGVVSGEWVSSTGNCSRPADGLRLSIAAYHVSADALGGLDAAFLSHPLVVSAGRTADESSQYEVTFQSMVSKSACTSAPFGELAAIFGLRASTTSSPASNDPVPWIVEAVVLNNTAMVCPLVREGAAESIDVYIALDAANYVATGLTFDVRQEPLSLTSIALMHTGAGFVATFDGSVELDSSADCLSVWSITTQTKIGSIKSCTVAPNMHDLVVMTGPDAAFQVGDSLEVDASQNVLNRIGDSFLTGAIGAAIVTMDTDISKPIGILQVHSHHQLCVEEPAALHLDGSSSMHSSGRPLVYLWGVRSASPGVEVDQVQTFLDQHSAASVANVPAAMLVAGALYDFSLVVVDSFDQQSETSRGSVRCHDDNQLSITLSGPQNRTVASTDSFRLESLIETTLGCGSVGSELGFAWTVSPSAPGISGLRNLTWLNVGPGSLLAGQSYSFHFTVSARDGTVSTSTNTRTVVVGVLQSPLVALLTGLDQNGGDAVVGTEAGFRVDASMSNDPDGMPGDLLYSWTCVQDELPCVAINSTGHANNINFTSGTSASVVQFAPSALHPGTYSIEVTVRKGDRASRASTVVSVTAAALPIVTIEKITLGDNSASLGASLGALARGISPNTKLAVGMRIQSASPASVQWSAAQGAAFDTVELSLPTTAAQQGSFESLLVLAPGDLAPGHYQFDCVVSNSRGEARNSITVRVNAPPLAGQARAELIQVGAGSNAHISAALKDRLGVYRLTTDSWSQRASPNPSETNRDTASLFTFSAQLLDGRIIQLGGATSERVVHRRLPVGTARILVSAVDAAGGSGAPAAWDIAGGAAAPHPNGIVVSTELAMLRTLATTGDWQSFISEMAVVVHTMNSNAADRRRSTDSATDRPDRVQLADLLFEMFTDGYVPVTDTSKSEILQVLEMIVHSSEPGYAGAVGLVAVSNVIHNVIFPSGSSAIGTSASRATAVLNIYAQLIDTRLQDSSSLQIRAQFIAVVDRIQSLLCRTLSIGEPAIDVTSPLGALRTEIATVFTSVDTGPHIADSQTFVDLGPLISRDFSRWSCPGGSCAGVCAAHSMVATDVTLGVLDEPAARRVTPLLQLGLFNKVTGTVALTNVSVEERPDDRPTVLLPLDTAASAVHQSSRARRNHEESSEFEIPDYECRHFSASNGNRWLAEGCFYGGAETRGGVIYIRCSCLQTNVYVAAFNYNYETPDLVLPSSTGADGVVVHVSFEPGNFTDTPSWRQRFAYELSHDVAELMDIERARVADAQITSIANQRDTYFVNLTEVVGIGEVHASFKILHADSFDSTAPNAMDAADSFERMFEADGIVVSLNDVNYTVSAVSVVRDEIKSNETEVLIIGLVLGMVVILMLLWWWLVHDHEKATTINRIKDNQVNPMFPMKELSDDDDSSLPGGQPPRGALHMKDNSTTSIGIDPFENIGGPALGVHSLVSAHGNAESPTAHSREEFQPRASEHLGNGSGSDPALLPPSSNVDGLNKVLSPLLPGVPASLREEGGGTSAHEPSGAADASAATEEEGQDEDDGGFICICGKSASMICSQCKNKGYCSVQCQRANWKAHRKECKRESRRRKSLEMAPPELDTESSNLAAPAEAPQAAEDVAAESTIAPAPTAKAANPITNTNVSTAPVAPPTGTAVSTVSGGDDAAVVGNVSQKSTIGSRPGGLPPPRVRPALPVGLGAGPRATPPRPKTGSKSGMGLPMLGVSMPPRPISARVSGGPPVMPGRPTSGRPMMPPGGLGRPMGVPSRPNTAGRMAPPSMPKLPQRPKTGSMPPRSPGVRPPPPKSTGPVGEMKIAALRQPGPS